MNSFKKNFYLTFGGVGVVCALLVGGFGYLLVWIILPYAEEFTSTEASIRTSEQSIAQYRQIVAPELARTNEEMSKVQHLFFDPEKDGGLSFILFLEKIVQRNNLTQKNVAPPTSKGKQPTMSFTVEGSYENILRFLREIENEAYLIAIDSVSIQHGADGLHAANFQLLLRSL